MNQAVKEQDRIDPKMVAVLASKTEAERLRIAWGMWRSAETMIQRLVAAEQGNLSPQEQSQVVAKRMSRGT
jgi:hypothetical protein